MAAVPHIRLQTLNEQSVRPDGRYVVYWMTAYRRLHHNFALQRAIEWCRQLNRPLLILEALRCDYRWASERLHAFVMEGMRDNSISARRQGVCYLPYVERHPGQGSGLLAALADQSCLIVADDFPCFFLPKMLSGAARQMPVLIESVDSNGLLPMRAAGEVFSTAYAFRRFLQRSLAEHLRQFPEADPLADPDLPKLSGIPSEISQRWPGLSEQELHTPLELIRTLPIDLRTGRGTQAGGSYAARQRLLDFLRRRLPDYAEGRNHPDQDAGSGLSAWLHFGHLSVHEVFAELASLESWTTDCPGDVRTTRGSRSGWWGMSAAAESFLDELVTWRELGFNMCWQRSDYDRYESLPEWAQVTLNQHAADPRPRIYSEEELTAGHTHDRIWNAAQNQLVREGRLHNYLRMLWGKKILEWTPDPRTALRVMIELNNRFALDGRNPNSYSGIFWVLGRYDRAWGPERPIFGKIRYMSSDNTARKLQLSRYLERFAPESTAGKLF